jgi:hypothetical protein
VVEHIQSNPPGGPELEIPEPRAEADGTASDLPPELHDALDEVMEGEPPPKRDHGGGPIQPEQPAASEPPGGLGSDPPGHYGELPGDEPAVDERADP